MSTTSKHPIDTPKNISKLYIDKIKREEEEEQWISGEELNTEGSSDEEEKGVGKAGSRNTKRQGHRGGARPKAQRCKRPDVPPLAPPFKQKEEGGSDSGDEPVDISWKPKRGSIRLPHVVTGNETNTKNAFEVPKE